MRRALAAVVLALTLAALATLPNDVRAAGAFDVHPAPCNAWGSWASNGWSNGIYCNGYSAFQLNTGAGITVGPAGTFMWQKSTRLPNATYLKTLKLSYLASQANGTLDHIQARACQRYAGQNDAWSGAPNGACVGAVFGLPTEVGYKALTIGEGTLACGTNCGGFQLDVSAGYSSGFVWIEGITGTIGDDTPPVVTSLFASHAISQGKWLRGNVEIGATGTDSNGSGIASMAFFPGDPNLLVSTSASCDYSQWIPCASSKGWTGTFDTTSVGDGVHTGYYTATDPAGRTGQSQSFTYKVDNTAPETPKSITPTTNGFDGWSSDNSIGAEWSNGPEVNETETTSGLEEVIVDVNPSSESQVDPPPVEVPIGGSASGITATKSSFSGLALPDAGAWIVRVQLVDKAGNVSAVGDGTGSSADSDVHVGFDPTPPAAPSGQSNGWISRDELAAGYDQEFTYTKSPSSFGPVCGFSHSIDEDPSGTAGSTITVPGGGSVRKLRLPGTLSEATHYVHLRSVSCSGLASPSTETVVAPVDRTDPVGTISGVENDHWYKDGQIVTLHATDALSGMFGAPGVDSDATHGAYLSYRLNGIGPTPEDSPRGASADITVEGEGSKTLAFQPVDLAGNSAAPTIAAFGIDATKPVGFVNKRNPSMPTVLSASVRDELSGVDYAVISVRRAGSADQWQPLPTSSTTTSRDDGSGNPRAIEANARFPDTVLKRGLYEVHLTAFDYAGNKLDTDRQLDGAVATIANPSRVASKIYSRLFRASRKCTQKSCAVTKCKRRRSTGCFVVRRGKVSLVGGSKSVVVPYNRGAVAMGILSDARNRPVASGDVVISTTEKASGKKAIIGTTKTDSNGIYKMRVPAGLNRTVVATYLGSETRENIAASASLRTRAKLTLKISRHHARTGQTVTFSGRVSSFDGTVPSAGKIVILQFRVGDSWRPAIALDHTNRKGYFKIKYRFDGRKVRARISFRVHAPAEGMWGHEASSSEPTVIRLN